MVVEVSSFDFRNNMPQIKSIYIRSPFEGGRSRTNRLEVVNIYKTSQKRLVHNSIPTTTTILKFQGDMLKDENKIHEEKTTQIDHQGIEAPIVLMKPYNHQICSPIVVAFVAPSLA